MSSKWVDAFKENSSPKFVTSFVKVVSQYLGQKSTWSLSLSDSRWRC